jgi:hypothetical protein
MKNKVWGCTAWLSRLHCSFVKVMVLAFSVFNWPFIEYWLHNHYGCLSSMTLISLVVKVPCYENVYCVKWQLSVKYFFACLLDCIEFDLHILIQVVRVPGRHAFWYDDPWILHMRGAQTTKATDMLCNLSVAGCVEYKTLTLSWPAEFKCVWKEKHETEIMRLRIEWQWHTMSTESHRKSDDLVESDP